MSGTHDPILSELFTRADSEPIGLVVQTTNVQALVVNLNIYRKAHRLHHLSICCTPDPNVIFIIRRSAELEP